MENTIDLSAITYKELKSESDDFKSLLPKLLRIETIAKGGLHLDPYQYLLIRDEEKKDITEKRIEKFVDHNYLGSAIRLQRIYQNSGLLQVDTESLPNQTKPWKTFLDKCNKKSQNLKEFILDVFESALIHKVCYVQIDTEELPPGVTELNEAQLENIDLPLPYVFTIPIQTLMSEECNGSEITWLKYKRVTKRNHPFKSTLYDFEYVFVDSGVIITWTYEDVILKGDSIDINKIWDSTLNNGKGGYRTINDKDLPNEVKVVEHKRGKCPVLRFEIPDTLYMTEQVYRSQAVIYGLCMNLLHTSANAGFVQKVLKPWLQQGSSSAGGASYIPLPKEAIAEIAKVYYLLSLLLLKN